VKYSVRFALEEVAAHTELRADPDRLMQVMANLLSNAAKFSPPESEVTVRSSERGAIVRIEVEDRGAGIPEAFQHRSFEKFAQADSSISRRFEGTGLGLSITRQLVEAMGGTIGFSTSGHGTIFYFELPRAGQGATPTQVTALASTPRLDPVLLAHPSALNRGELPRILYMEDNVDLNKVIQASLAGKAEVVAARTLQEAEKRLSEETFALLLLDIALPDGDGLSLLEGPALTARPLPVVILSITHVSRRLWRRVAAALVKSRVSEAHILQTILSLLPQHSTQDDCNITANSGTNNL
jgi:CheY-like chemotaxis protein